MSSIEAVHAGAGSTGSCASLVEALDLGRHVWDDLLARTDDVSPFMSWAWHRALADGASAQDLSECHALLVRGADQTVQALLPVSVRRVLFRRMRVNLLGWAIGDIGCPDHLDVLACREVDLDAVLPAIESLPWDVIRLANLVEGAPNAARLAAALARRGHRVRWRVGWSCPYLELPGSWDDYLGTLSSTRRQMLRREERKLVRERAAVLTDYEPGRWQEGWAHLRALHERRWNGASELSAPSTEQLHRRFAQEWADRGQVWLTTLDLDGEPAAAWYGFADEHTVYFYQGGRDPRWARASVGKVLMGMMVRRAFERGYRRFDFLRGDDPYKLEWTRTERTTRVLVVFRRGVRGRWLQALDRVGGWKARLMSPRPKPNAPR